MLGEIKLDGDPSALTAERLTEMIDNPDIQVTGFYSHTKASEEYVALAVSRGRARRDWVLPYVYRRTGTRADSAESLCAYIRERSGLLTEEKVAAFKKRIGEKAPRLFGGAPVTKPIFLKLLAKCGDWVCNKEFDNPNPQRRIQSIKGKGFTIATKIEGGKTFHALLPFPPARPPLTRRSPRKPAGASSRR